MAVAAVLDAELAWVCEHEPPTDRDPNPSQAGARLLAHRFPQVPNHGDLTTTDWSRVEPVDVLTAGFPCQDVSSAGLRAGLRGGNRTGLWLHIAGIIDRLRPQLVVLENVRGLITARGAPPTDELLAAWAARDKYARVLLLIDAKSNRAYKRGQRNRVQRLQRDEVRVLGLHRQAMAAVDRADARIVRAIGAVLGDLADLGFDANWCLLPASSVGAPHRRERIFIVARPTADTQGERRNTWAAGHETSRPDWLGRPNDRRGGEPATDPEGAGREGPRPQPSRCGFERGGSAAPDPDGGAVRQQPVPDPGSGGAAGAGPDRQAAPDPAGDGRGEGRPEPAGQLRGPDAPQCGDASPADTPGHGDTNQSGSSGRPLPCIAEPGAGGGDRRRPDAARAHGMGGGAQLVEWGAYRAAIGRWERILGRPAPAPTVLGKRGGRQLSPRFVEWLQGLPEGWVTDVPGLSRNQQLKLLGNGVVPLQCEAALRHLLPLLSATWVAA